MSSPFPAEFLWGVATAAHQVEGGNVNNDVWFLEHVPGTMFAEPSGDAVDHYHRYAHDVALIASLGFTAYRFSLEWARIEPEPGQFSTAELDHYRRVLECCREHGLSTVVTLHHFSSPRWLLARGGWESDETVALFARYVTRVVEHLGDLIDVACTLNEPNLPWLLADEGLVEREPAQREQSPFWTAAGAALGVPASAVAPFQFTATDAGYRVKLAAHRAGYDAVKALHPEIPVGWTLANSDIQALPGGEERAERARREINLRFLEQSRDDDFVGIQTYGRTLYGADGVAPAPTPADGEPLDQLGREIYAPALAATVREAAAVAGVPVLVTENGLATDDDELRERYVADTLTGLARCLEDGVAVLGYTYWTAFDNYEWIFGYRPRFGMIAVDRDTQRREPKPSAYALGEIARTGGAALLAADRD